MTVKTGPSPVPCSSSDVKLRLLHLLDHSGWGPLPAGPSGEVQTGVSVRPGGVSAGETDGQPTVLPKGVWIQPNAGEDTLLHPFTRSEEHTSELQSR